MNQVTLISAIRCSQQCTCLSVLMYVCGTSLVLAAHLSCDKCHVWLMVPELILCICIRDLCGVLAQEKLAALTPAR